MPRLVLTTLLASVVLLSPLPAEARDADQESLPLRQWSAPPFFSFPKAEKPDQVSSDPAAEPLSAEAAGAAPPELLPFVSISPCRIADTRGNGFTGQAGPPALNTGPRAFQITGVVPGVSTQCGIPSFARAASFQFTIVTPNSAGNLIAWPGGPAPTISVLNWSAGETALGNGTVVPLSVTGSLSVQINAAIGGATGHLVLDVNGYYGPSLEDTFVSHNEPSSVTSAMIADGAIVNADINASAAIADTKLTTIASAGKVADTALSSNVTKLGSTIEGSEITNITRSVFIPLTDFTDCGTGTGALLDFGNDVDTKPNFANTGSAGSRVSLVFDAAVGSPDQDYEICSSFGVPLDYASGGEFYVRAVLTTAPDPATEVLNCSAGRFGQVHGAIGTVPIASNSNAAYVCTPTLTGLTAGELVDFFFLITSNGTMDDFVRIYSVEFRYVASQ